MNVELDWKAADQDGVWETVAAYTTRRRRGIPSWVWIALCAALVTASATSYLLVRQRYGRALRQITFQVQGVIDLEARALDRGDIALYLQQQDRSQQGWILAQAQRVTSNLPQCTLRLVPGFACYDECPSAQAPQVQRLEMRGDVAWVEVVGGHPPLRQTRFYRQTDRGWLHTAPHAPFWNGTIERRTDHLLVRYSQRDQPHVEALLDHMERVVSDVDAHLPESPRRPLPVDFTGTQLERLPDFVDDRLTLASLWLSGIPADGRWDGTAAGSRYLRLLTYWIAYARTGQYLSVQANAPHSDPLADRVLLNYFQDAIISEYATAYSLGDLAQAPVPRQALHAAGLDSFYAECADPWLDMPIAGTCDLFIRTLSTSEHQVAHPRQENVLRLVALCRLTRRGNGPNWLGAPSSE